MSVVVKRRLTYATIVIYNFFCGVEYAVIFPSLWGYLRTRFNAPSFMMGIIIAALSVSGLFSNPLVGKLADHYPNTKLIMCVTNLGEIIGSFMYFMGISPWFLVASRLVSGIGIGGGAAVMADITRSTVEENRTGLLSIVMALRQIGLLIGPAFNFLFLSLDYDIGPFHLDKYSAPGLFMSCVWIVLEFFFIFMYFNLTSLIAVEHIEEQLTYGYRRTASRNEPTTPGETTGSEHFSWPQPPASIRDVVDHAAGSCTPKSPLPIPPNELFARECEGESNLMIESAEQYIIRSEEAQNRTLEEENDEVGNWRLNSSKKKRISRSSSHATLLQSFNEFSKVYLRDEVVILLAIVFTSITAQTSFETIVTPLTKEFYDYEESQNSMIYIFAGAFTLLVFGAIHFVSKKFSDRILLLVGQIVLLFAMCWFLIFIPTAKKGSKSSFLYATIGTVLDLIAIPLLIVCSASLLSKITSYENQAFTHGLRRSALSIGCIIGPLWGGAFLEYRYILFAVPLGVSLLFLILFLNSFPDLKPKVKEVSISEAPTRPVSEVIEDPIVTIDDQRNLINTQNLGF